MYFYNMFYKCIGVLLACGMVVSMLSCESKNSTSSSVDSPYEAVIQFSAGDDFVHLDGEESRVFTPYPFNMGYIRGTKNDRLQCIVLSPKLSPRSRLHINPIAVFTTKEQGIEISYIIAVPTEHDENSIGIENFSDLVTKYASVKNIIEFWILNRCGLGCAENLSWGNESTASFVLEKFKES